MDEGVEAEDLRDEEGDVDAGRGERVVGLRPRLPLLVHEPRKHLRVALGQVHQILEACGCDADTR